MMKGDRLLKIFFVSVLLCIIFIAFPFLLLILLGFGMVFGMVYMIATLFD